MCFSIKIDKNLKALATKFDAKPVIEEFQKLRHLVDENPKLGFKIPDLDGRVFPNYFAPITIAQKENRLILPMRYRVRPHNSAEEVPTKYNLFNARLDSLLTRQTWKSLVGRNHGIVKLEKFYEWVPDPDKENKRPRLISFTPENKDEYFTPCLFDYWVSLDKKFAYYSFAVITTDPANDVMEMGHDRTPIFLSNEKIDAWLKCKDKENAIEQLQNGEQLRFSHEF